MTGAVSRQGAGGRGSTPPRPERTLLVLRPHPAFILLRPLGALAAVGTVAAAALWLGSFWGAPLVTRGTLLFAGALGSLVLVWHGLAWRMQCYVLTSHRLIRTSGVLQRLRIEIPLNRVQHIAIYRSFRERLFGLGTVGFSTAGSAWMEMAWLMVERPEERLAGVRAAMDVGGGETEPQVPVDQASGGQSRGPSPGAAVPVIGLAGGIGAGKSEVARMLEALGCYVIDSDEQARLAIQYPGVRDQLVRWWGRGILAADGSVDRRQVAKIVFGDDQERLRLEGLIHPLVRTRRQELIGEARLRGAGAAVIDAPLLFEAGVDQECDAVIFVDAPREVRLRRLGESRGWDEAELARRERAQMPLEEKRRRSQYIIENAGDLARLGQRTGEVLRAITG